MIIIYLAALLFRQGESFESEPSECIGNSGYQPTVREVSVKESKATSAPPIP